MISFITMFYQQKKLSNGEIAINYAIKSCPWCFLKPSVFNKGNVVKISCCAKMVFHKVDYLTEEERKTYNFKTKMYSEELERGLLLDAITVWNTRLSTDT